MSNQSVNLINYNGKGARVMYEWNLSRKRFDVNIGCEHI